MAATGSNGIQDPYYYILYRWEGADRGFWGFFFSLCCRDPADTILSPKECAVQGELKGKGVLMKITAQRGLSPLK